MKQLDLLHGEHLSARVQYQALFEFLPPIPHSYQFGRPGIDPNVMLRAFIYRCLRRLPTLSDLNYSLRENPSLSEGIGLDPFAPPPSIERFSRWLRSTSNETLQSIRFILVRRLVDSGAVHGKIVAFDSTAILSPVKENNLKTTVADRFNKHRYPKTDPEARLGACRYYMASKTQKIRFFWGYRNHALVDFQSELPLWEETHPANYHANHCAIPLLEACSQKLNLLPQVVCGDSAYDAEKILAYIVEHLHARPVIASNARYQPNPDFRVQGKVVLCPAALPMIHKGRMTPKRTGITYTQYACPLHYNQSLRQKYLLSQPTTPNSFLRRDATTCCGTPPRTAPKSPMPPPSSRNCIRSVRPPNVSSPVCCPSRCRNRPCGVWPRPGITAQSPTSPLCSSPTRPTKPATPTSSLSFAHSCPTSWLNHDSPKTDFCEILLFQPLTKPVHQKSGNVLMLRSLPILECVRHVSIVFWSAARLPPSPLGGGAPSSQRIPSLSPPTPSRHQHLIRSRGIPCRFRVPQS